MSGCVIRAREAAWRCWATESAIKRNAVTFSGCVVARWELRGGISLGRERDSGGGDAEDSDIFLCGRGDEMNPKERKRDRSLVIS